MRRPAQVIVSKYFADKRERARLAHYKDWLVQNNIAPEVRARRGS